MEPQIVSLFWYRNRQDYAKLLSVFKDRANLPESFDAWLKKAEAIRLDQKMSGRKVVRAYVDADTFVAWCALNGCDVDGKARTAYANRIAFEIATGLRAEEP